MNGAMFRTLLGLVWFCTSLAHAAARPDELKILSGTDRSPTRGEVKETARFTELPSWATSVAFSADDQTLAIGLKNRVQLVDVSHKTLGRALEFKAGQVRSLSFSADGKFLAVGGYQFAGLVDAQTGALLHELKGHRGSVTGVAFSPDSKFLATACEDEVGRIWTLTPEPMSKELRGHGYPLTAIAWSADGTLVATAAGDELRPTKAGQVKVWNAATAEVKHTFELHSKAATGVAFSPDGRFLLSSSVDEHVNVYDLTSGKPLGYFAGHSRPTNAVSVHPDGETAVSVSGGRAVGKNELMIWEFETGEPLVALEAHEAKITAVAVSHNGSLVATAGQDKSVALWNTAFLTIGLSQSVAATGTTSATNPAASTDVAADQVAVPIQAATALQTENAPAAPKTLRVGVIGLDTSHAPAFAKTLNASKPVAGAEGCRVVAAYPKGSPDIKTSLERVPEYTEEFKKMGIEIVDSIEELLKRVDVVLLETNDGRPHYEQLLPCLKAGKPCFIDKPIAGSLADAIAIFEASKKYKVPVFSSSSLRFGKNSLAVRAGSIGQVKHCFTTSPASLEPSHPDLFWYGIHGVESLFTVMGKGCESVVRSVNSDGKIEVTGKWKGDRTGIYREGPGYTGTAQGEKGEAAVGSYDGYDPLVIAIVKFFHTGEAPVSPEETLEIYAFMEAADESKRQNGKPVTLESVMEKARQEAAKKLAQ
ncbi:Gfo/Idh/MocA family oxidoreductase [Schlesneria sp. DSM 10557]|uniref:Gfo/Idh/MocA family oxidoreductase n=1 Tax=Schlesneria sp. DSM 10557 TaxID=3044399 RepID=UPI0035A0AA0C